MRLGSVSRRWVLLAGASLVAACSAPPSAPPIVSGENAEFAQMLDTLANDIIRQSPETATSLGFDETKFGGRYNDRIDDRGQAAFEARRIFLLQKREELATVLADQLSPSQKISLEVVRTQIDNSEAGARFGFGAVAPIGWFSPYVVSQLDGAYLGLPDFLDAQHAIKTLQDARDYVTRLGQVADAIDKERLRALADADAGVIAPDFVIRKLISQARGFIAAPAAQSIYHTSFTRRIAEIADPAAADELKSLSATAADVVATQIYPAYERFAAAFDGLLAKATSDAGVWKLANGADYYAAALRLHTTTNLSADQIHELGVAEVNRLQGEMDAILQSLGHTTGTVAERMAKLRTDPQYLYPNTDEGRATLLADLNTQMTAIQARLPEQFGRLPKAGVEIRRVPEFSQDGAPGGYYQSPTLDGSRPGAYYINLRDTAEWPKYTLPTLTYHEASPGHHHQSVIALENEDLPFIRRFMWFPAYGEGWALYSEQLADEMGVYDGKPVDRLGYLQSLAFRAARLVVDTGLHHKKWTREQAIEYMASATGDDLSSVTTEIERYAVWPGQACSYMVGRLEIVRLRDKAKTALGDSYDQRAFHDAVLGAGAMPLSTLESVVDAWIAAQAKA